MRPLLLLTALVLMSCRSSREGASARASDRQKIKTELEVSLKADRERLSELRKEIPEEKQKANDEMALFLSLMKQGTEQPQQVREKFNAIVEKKRSAFRAKVQRLREDFRVEETRKRENFLTEQKNLRDKFLTEQKNLRDKFLKKKGSSSDSRDFFSDQDRSRSRFFADERDRRQNFESELSAQSKDFESYMRERNNEFNEQYRLYSKEFSERPKEKKAVTGEAGSFEKLKQMNAAPLGTTDR